MVNYIMSLAEAFATARETAIHNLILEGLSK